MQHKKLGELFKISSGGTPSKKNNEFYNNGNIPWIKTGDLKTKYIDSASEYITELAVKNSSAKLFPTNTVLIAMYGATIGATSILKIDATTNQACCAFLPNDCIVPEYLYYFFKFNKEKIVQMGVGGAQPNISASILKRIEIPFIDLEKQKKLVNILDKAQELIDKRKEQIEALDELVKSKFIDMFGSQSDNQKSFNIVAFDYIIDYIGDIGSNGANSVISANLKMTDTEDYALMVRTTNFTTNDFENNAKYVSKEVYDFFKKSKVYGGELIFNKIGSAGINFVMPYLNRPVSLGLNQIMVRTNEKVNMIYLYNLLNTDYGKYQIKKRVQGAVTKSITKGAIKEIPIMLPPIELQNQFSDFVKQVDELKSKMEKSLKELEDNFNSLIQKAFNGKLFN